MRNELHEMSKRMNELNLRIKGIDNAISGYKVNEAEATKQEDKDLFTLQIKQLSGKKALFKTALKLMDLEFKKAVRGGDYDFTIDFINEAAHQINQAAQEAKKAQEAAGPAADPKPIDDMTLCEINDEIVELQYNQLFDGAPFTYADWRRLLALRGEYERRTDPEAWDAWEPEWQY